MENASGKQLSKPSLVCQYGKGCYRKNPQHFMEYSHIHLDKIIEENSTVAHIEDYKIPNSYMMQRDLIIDQIKIVDKLFPTSTSEPCTKKNKPGTSQQLTLDGHNKTKSSKDSDSVSQTISSNINIHEYIKVVVPKGKMAEKLAAARPYNYFLTCIPSSPATHNESLSITFQEILDISLGELESSVQINFMVDLGFLLGQYYFAGYLNKPLLILYGSGSKELETISNQKPQIKTHLIRMPTPFSTHHTKMMLFAYKDGSMRVVVSTANLYEDDWHNRTQGLWMSDRLEALPDGSDTRAGESSTEFRNELLKYLSSYKLPQLQPWLTRIRKTNFSSVNVFLVTSIPGTYHETAGTGYPHGHCRVAWLLSKYSSPIDESSAIVAQSSSLGSFGSSPDVWLTNEFLNSFRRDTQSTGLRKLPNIRIIYPSFNNVANSHDGLLGGGCLPYGNQVHQKQLWLNDFLYQWRSDCRHRSKAMPHIKTYARWSEKKLFWYLLTSANLSRAAWGSLSKTKTSPTLRINNYEAGVMFLPKFFSNATYFSMDVSDTSTPQFPALYDIPLTKYVIDDTPFCSDVLLS